MNTQKKFKQNIKKISDSVSEQVHVLTMKTLNGNQRLSGAQLMEWVDEVSVVVARRHSESDVTTVCIQDLQFLKAAVNKDTVVVRGKMIFAGKSSMLIRVNVYIERFFGEQTLIATGKVLMVALDEHEHPCPVPCLQTESEEEKAEYDFEEKKYNERNIKR